MAITQETRGTRLEPRLLLLLCAAVLFAGWVKFLFDDYTVYILDYLFRVLCLTVVFWNCSLIDLAASPSRWVRTLVLTAIVFYVELSNYQVYRYFQVPDPLFYNQLFHRLEEGSFLYFDLTVGLVLVALSEEIVFRYLFAKLWQHRGWSTATLYMASSIAFGLLHLPQGWALVAFTSITGILFMFLYRFTDSLWPVVVVHYLLNFLIFSSVGCEWGVTGCLPA